MPPVGTPETRYAWNGDISIAYQTLGDGPVDLVYLQGYLSNVELNWEHPACARFLQGLARSARVVMMDRRGLGCSERFTPADTPPLESLMDDVVAVLDEVGTRNPVLLATGDCGPIGCFLAATYPDRLGALILYGTSPSWRRSDEIPWGQTDEAIERENRATRDALGDGTWTRNAAPSLFSDEGALRWAGRYERLSLTPGSVYWEGVRFGQTDVRALLPSIRVPTLVLHRTDDPLDNVRSGRYLAEHIPGSRFRELPGADHLPWAGDQHAVLREVDGFLDVLKEEQAHLDRVLATVLFTDIVGSTAKSAAMGDGRWREVREEHDRIVRAQLARYRGREIQSLGDGFLATFDGPARGVLCAQAVVEGVKPLGIEIRAGLHTGEVQPEGDDLSGIAVAIAARIVNAAGPSEVLVSQTIRDLTAGSGLSFEDRGEHELKGVPDRWRLFAVTTRSRLGV